MVSKCFTKCVVRHNESELAVGEMACVDRCVGKYLQAQDKVGKVLADFEKQLKAQESAGLPTYGALPKK